MKAKKGSGLLCLDRKTVANEIVVVKDNQILASIFLLKATKGKAKLGLCGPSDVKFFRREVLDKIKEESNETFAEIKEGQTTETEIGQTA